MKSLISLYALTLIISDLSPSSAFFRVGRNFRASRNRVDREDANLQVPELAQKYGFPSESHRVTTEDGYILTLHRIPSPGRPVVAFFHGIVCSSKEWFLPVTGSAMDSIGFMVANAGYDAWFFNARGNHYSKDHVNLSTTSFDYWDFGDDEQAQYDIPATIDYILNATDQKQLNYIGFSLGTILFFKGMSFRPEYNHKIRLFIGYAAGGGSFTNNTSPIANFLASMVRPEEPLKSLLTLFGGGSILLPSFLQPIIQPIWFLMCGSVRTVCDELIYAMTGFSPNKINDDVWDVLWGEFPSTSSVRTGIQVLQESNVVKPASLMYDHGRVKNMRIYGSPTPPEYNISLVTAKCVLFSGLTDGLIDYKDTDWLAQILPNVVASIRANYPNSWAHQDYYLARQAPDLIYRPTMEFLQVFNQIE